MTVIAALAQAKLKRSYAPFHKGEVEALINKIDAAVSMGISAGSSDTAVAASLMLSVRRIIDAAVKRGPTTFLKSPLGWQLNRYHDELKRQVDFGATR